MTISATTTIASEVEAGVLSAETRAYFQARLRNRLYDLVLRKFSQAEGEKQMTKAELARRIGRRPEVITRLLSSPGNWTLDTVSDLLLGIAGEEPDVRTAKPGAAAATNYSYQDYTGLNGRNRETDGKSLNEGRLQPLLNNNQGIPPTPRLIDSADARLDDYLAGRIAA
jgi:hypothetical protein